KNYWKEEYRFKKANGSYRYIFDRGFIIRDKNGNAIRMIGAMQDVTEQKLKEQQIIESKERLANALKATNDLIWDWNLETGSFYRDKEGMKKVYGVEDEKSIQNIHAWMQRVHPSDVSRVEKVMNDILHATKEDIFDVEYRFQRDDGTFSYIYDRGIIIRNKEGKPVRMVGAAQNITERKNLEQQLLQRELDKQKLISQATIETQEQERSEIGKELHDNINQILTTTKLYLELSQVKPNLKDELIGKSIRNINCVINEIRQLSRSLMNPSLGDLGLIDSIQDLIANINVTQKFHVLFEADDIDDFLNEKYKVMLFRIIQEALNNIIRHSAAKTVNVKMSKLDNEVELSICDDGVGFNVKTTKKGAGLMNIQNRVYLVNGSLKITSAPGCGCKIIINFPIHNS
ncbi:MAG: PAS domain-containing protein, partial [Chitinophagaceae bacterium]|nr:PAS domain-containing protein [Chitinophagaceae bacterium]